jgi:DNA-binding HxlR family transcriptional regulator
VRSYGQACPIAHGLDLIGERWALLVIRELRLGPRRYVDLQAALPGIGPSVLSQRLRDLERVGVLRRRRLPPPAASTVYELTEWGAELEPVFTGLARWAVRSPVVPLEGDVSEDSVMLGFPTFFDAQEPWTASYDIRLERERYRLEVVDGRLVSIRRGEGDGPADAVLETDRASLMAAMAGAPSLDGMTVTGDAGAVRRLLAAVRLTPAP